MKIYLFSLIAALFIGLAGCDEEFDPGQSSTYPLNGEWYVMEDGFYGEYGPYWVYVYNTAADDGEEIWVENIWDSDIQVKATVNGNAFTVTEGEDISGTVDVVTIESGKVDGDNISFTAYLFGTDSVGNITDTYDIIDVTGTRKTGFE